MSHRHKCFVPDCPNSVSKTPDKVFVHVNDFFKRKWCNQLKIVYQPRQRLYCCEDHLNLEEDLENYYEWKFSQVRPRLKNSTNLQYSQENIHNAHAPSTSEVSYEVEKRIERDSELKRILLQPKENIQTREDILGKDVFDWPTTSSACTFPVKVEPVHASTQTDPVKMVDKTTLVRKLGEKKSKQMPSMPSINEESGTPVSASPSICGFTSDTDVSMLDIGAIKKSITHKTDTLELLYKYPKMYLGIPKEYIFVIKLIAKRMKGKEIDILITLMKIKMNDSLTRLGHLFSMSRQTVTKSFHKGLTMLANYFQHFVYMPNPLEIKRNLPLVYKIRYSNVQCIIDGFEIEIEKPTNSESQAQTWPQYKHCNTLKYIVGCTPNGLISYISKGYGGRTSDKALVEISNFIDNLPINAIVMADRGFKEIESLLATKNIRLLRPPSVYSHMKPTQQEVLEAKVIASLRVHVERVIRRIREFRLLKPHSVGYMDKFVLICCELINLQNEIIKQ